jgi:peptidoglycan hydrolase-like protein with peptidoglycan-binding domain
VPSRRSFAVGLAAFGLALPITASAEAKRYAFGSRPLSEGSRGSDVRTLQRNLTKVGLRTEIDGMYGPHTARRVKSWERRSGVRRVNGRLSRREARTMSGQVARGVKVFQPAPETQPAPSGEQATLNSDGTANAPASAPAAVKGAIAAANRIVGKPYKYGGGHGRWEDSGYDCSGAMSYALHGGGLLNRQLTSGDFMSWGRRGKGSWITVYANSGHGYLVIAGLRFDTGWHGGGKGPRWSDEMRPADGYVIRHPRGF